ncbi:MAG: DUF6544 family protein [Gemmatimonadales bacterium]
MKIWLRRSAGVLGAGAVAGALAIGVASRRWDRTSARLINQMTRRPARPAGTVSLRELDSLPAPVERYFRAVLRDGQPRIRSARVTQTGEFRTKESADPATGWQPFTATQVFTTERPGLVWDARIRLAPLVSVRIRDAYVDGQASMLGAVLALATVVDETDRSELRAGALQRYLAESVWFPTALVPRNGLAWTAIDDTHARATLSDGETSVALDFEFGAGGEIVGSFTPRRLRAVAGVKGRYDALPWGGRYRRYEERDGIRVPIESEVYWVVGGREQAYYRGRNVRVDFEFGARP